jgi:outer membrane protein TolC
VKIADQQVLASQLKAEGERKQRWPAIDLVGQYALLARFNNYDEFYRKFQRNNATIGLAIRVPLFNFAQNARTGQAEADAVKAQHQAAAVKSQVSAETLKLQSAVKQLNAARDVAQLEYELARADTNTAEASIQAGKATIGDVASARVAEEEKFGAVLDATFELQKAQLQLLRATGELENWALARK